MGEFAYAEALRALSQGAAGTLDEVLAAACTRASAWDPVVYLADFSRQVLLPLDPRLAEEEVSGTLAGRAYTTGQPVISDRDGYARIWVPVLVRTTRTGVLGMSVPEASQDTVRQAEVLGVFAGLVVAALSRVSDAPHVRRGGQDMSLPASMQWDLLPPWSTRLPGALIAGMLEPAYDIAGDAFDYAADDGTLHFAIIDGMGHGISSTMLTGLAIGAYRHARRHGAPVPGIHVAIDSALADYYDDYSFATGIIATLTLSSGLLEWSCAGHPPPLLLRDRKVIAELDCEATPPFGLAARTPTVSSRDLEPDDAVLLYTDGVIDARTADGELFGLTRLADLLEREAASEQPPEELLRRLVRAVLDHQGGGLRDDATLLLLRWTGLPVGAQGRGDAAPAGPHLHAEHDDRRHGKPGERQQERRRVGRQRDTAEAGARED
jgi:serine phosphatase RsbU (regulator of sigma subunit)